MWGLPATTTGGTTAVINWCWVSDAAPWLVRLRVHGSVRDNLVDGLVQAPNPGCN
jgi:hypothetical protein